MNLQMDDMKSYKCQYWKLDRTKIRRMRNFYERMSFMKNKLMEENRKSKVYVNGICGPFNVEKPEPLSTIKGLSDSRKWKVKSHENDVCKDCGKKGHLRTS